MKIQKYEEFHQTTSFQKKLISKNNFTYRIILGIISKYLGQKKQVLDIGCGAGTISFYIVSQGSNITGIDISKKAVESCKESARLMRLTKSAHFEVADFPNRIPTKFFDLIICCEVLEHLEDDRLALKKIFQLLKPRGVAVISTPSSNAPLYRLGLATEFDKRVGHLRRYTIKTLVNKCRESGLLILETRKTEGIIRNFLFLNPYAGMFIKFIKFFISDIVTFLDNLTIKFFGESQIFVVVQKQ